MLEELLRLGGTFAVAMGAIGFWYYVMSRTGSF